MFDIVNYYPSISEKILRESLQFASLHMSISDDDIELFIQ